MPPDAHLQRRELLGRVAHEAELLQQQLGRAAVDQDREERHEAHVEDAVRLEGVVEDLGVED